LKKKVLTKCHSEVSEIVDALYPPPTLLNGIKHLPNVVIRHIGFSFGSFANKKYTK
jgi:hypothetical protein